MPLNKETETEKKGKVSPRRERGGVKKEAVGGVIVV